MSVVSYGLIGYIQAPDGLGPVFGTAKFRLVPGSIFADPRYFTISIVLKDGSANSIYDLSVGQVSVETNAQEPQHDVSRQFMIIVGEKVRNTWPNVYLTIS